MKMSAGKLEEDLTFLVNPVSTVMLESVFLELGCNLVRNLSYEIQITGSVGTCSQELDRSTADENGARRSFWIEALDPFGEGRSLGWAICELKNGLESSHNVYIVVEKP